MRGWEQCCGDSDVGKGMEFQRLREKPREVEAHTRKGEGEMWSWKMKRDQIMPGLRGWAGDLEPYEETKKKKKRILNGNARICLHF